MVYQGIGINKDMSRCNFFYFYFIFDLESLKEVQSFKALKAKIYLITNGLVVVMYLCSPNSNPIKCGNYRWFCEEIGCELFQALEGGYRGALADFFIG